MEVILEALFVGIYSLLLFIPLSYVFHKWILLFILGFVKHFLGYIFNLHNYYCNYGNACSSYFSNLVIPGSLYVPQNYPILVLESLIEGFCFVILGYLFTNINMYSIFIIGCIMHILTELGGIHFLFCKNKCNIVN